MLTIEKKDTDKGMLYTLSGIVNENVEFRGVFGEIPQKSIFNCQAVTRINSIGVKGWIKFFSSIKDEGKSASFEALSICLIDQANNVRNFLCDFPVHSVCVPFLCDDSNDLCVHVFSTEDLKKCNYTPPDMKCAQSKGMCTFDDIPDQFFAFLKENE